MTLRISMAVGDPLRAPGDALVRPVSATLEGTTPWSRQVEVAGGEALARRLAAVEGLPSGAVLVTPSGELPFELLLHAVVLAPGEPLGRTTLLRALTNALRQALEWEVRVLVLPVLGAGPGQLGVEEALEVLADALAAALADAPEAAATPAATPGHPRPGLRLHIPLATLEEARLVRETLERGLPGVIIEGPDTPSAARSLR